MKGKIRRLVTLTAVIAALLLPWMSGTSASALTVTKYHFPAPPIAVAGSIGPGQSVSFAVKVLSKSAPVPGGQVYLASGFESGSGYGGGISGDSTTVPGSQCGNVTQLSTTPILCTADSQGQVMLTYHVPAQPPAQGRADWIAGNAAVNPTITAVTHYVYSTEYRFSPSPMAPSGSLGASASVPITLSASASADVGIANDTVFLSFTATTGGGSAAVGTAALTSTPTLFQTDATGNIQLTYIAPATPPTSGTDSIVVQDLAASPEVVSSDTYAFVATTPVVSVGDVTVVEGDQHPAVTADFTVTLSAAQTTPVTVRYFTLCGIGDKGCGPHSEDFLQVLPSAPGIVTIPAGATSATINVPQYSYIGGHGGEAYVEGWYVELINPTGAILGRSVGEGVLLPDIEGTNTALPDLYVGGAALVPVSNGANTPIYFSVTLGAAESSPVTFTYTTADGTAKAGVDYVFASGTGVIPANATSVAIPVMLMPNSPPLTPTSFTLTISNPSGGLAIGRATGTGIALAH
jgi:Calx-beta domain